MKEDEQEDNNEFPIREPIVLSLVKNKSPTSLSNFDGLATEDPETFLTEFKVVFQTRD